jgi:hypothetical protein
MSDHIPRKDVKLPPTVSEAKLMARIEELEAKLARAVEMLDRLSFARTTLAEMKGEDRG